MLYIPRIIKCCTKCGKQFPASRQYFTRNKLGELGLSAECHICLKERSRQYRESNRDKTRIACKKSYHKDIEKTHASKRRRYNIEKARQRKRKARQTKTDYIRMQDRKWQNNRRAIKKAMPATFTTADWKQAINYWHGACAYCGNPPSLFDRHLVLHADHFVPLSRTDSSGTVATNILPACQSCNLSKHDADPHVWLRKHFGNRKAKQIEKRIAEYFIWVKGPSQSSQVESIV